MASRKRKTGTTAAGQSPAQVSNAGFRLGWRNQLIVLCLLVVLCLLIWGNSTSTPSSFGPVPVVYSYKVIAEYPHSTDAFTQGLLFAADGNSLLESTGMYERTQVRRIDRVSGELLQSTDAPASAFGEGLMEWKGMLLQLDWRKNTGFVYNSSTLEATGTLTHPYSDGWGFTGSQTSENEFIMTDNGHHLLTVRPTLSSGEQQVELSEVRRVAVHDQGAYLTMINELEQVKGEIFANIFGKDCIARINPADGSVAGWILLDGILKDPVPDRNGNNVLNGIAFDPNRPASLFVTGKEWPKMYEIELQVSSVPVSTARRMCLPTRNIFTGWTQA